VIWALTFPNPTCGAQFDSFDIFWNGLSVSYTLPIFGYRLPIHRLINHRHCVEVPPWYSGTSVE
jgi:hypothetical protein